jgi:hypothetical protein
MHKEAFTMSLDKQQTENLADVAGYLASNAAAEKWASGYGAIQHTDETRARVIDMASVCQREGVQGDGVELFELLHAADRVASAGMWLVVHQTYAQNVYLDGRTLATEDFKPKPEGHTGGSLNMVPAYTGYLAANALTGNDSGVDHGPRALRLRDRFVESACRQHDCGARRSVLGRRRRTEVLRAGFLFV